MLTVWCRLLDTWDILMRTNIYTSLSSSRCTWRFQQYHPKSTASVHANVPLIHAIIFSGSRTPGMKDYWSHVLTGDKLQGYKNAVVSKRLLRSSNNYTKTSSSCWIPSENGYAIPWSTWWWIYISSPLHWWKLICQWISMRFRILLQLDGRCFFCSSIASFLASVNMVSDKSTALWHLFYLLLPLGTDQQKLFVLLHVYTGVVLDQHSMTYITSKWHDAKCSYIADADCIDTNCGTVPYTSSGKRSIILYSRLIPNTLVLGE